MPNALNRVKIRMIFFIKHLSEPKVIISGLPFSAERSDFDKHIKQDEVLVFIRFLSFL